MQRYRTYVQVLLDERVEGLHDFRNGGRVPQLCNSYISLAKNGHVNVAALQVDVVRLQLLQAALHLSGIRNGQNQPVAQLGTLIAH